MMPRTLLKKVKKRKLCNKWKFKKSKKPKEKELKVKFKKKLTKKLEEKK
jgi:hypothetical protein